MVDRVFALLRMRRGVLLSLGALGGLISLEAELVQQRDGSAWALGGLALELLARWPLAAALTVAFQTLFFPRRLLGAWAALRGVAGKMPQLLLTLVLSGAVLALMVLTTVDLLRSARGGWTLDPVNWALAGAMGVLILYLAALWALMPAVVLLEGRMLFGALGRSAELMRLRFSRRLFGDSAVRRLILLITLAVAAAVGGQLLLPAAHWVIAGMPPLSPAELFGTAPADKGGGRGAWENAQLALTALLSCLIWPYIQTAIAVLYAECRMRREGLDLQARLLARENSGEPCMIEQLT